MHYYQHHIGDYLKDTAHLSLVEDAIYRRLIEFYYLHEKPLVDNIPFLARQIRARDNEEQVSQILSEFFELTKNGWEQKRCNVEIYNYNEICERNRLNGKRGGRPKKTQSVVSGKPKQNPDKTQTKANHEPLTINQEPIKNKYAPPIGDVLLSAWMEVRKAKRAGKVTELVFKGIEREAALAGITPEQAIQICVERSWQSFKAEWIKTKVNSPPKMTSTDRQIAMANEMFGGLVNGRRREIDISPSGTEGDRQVVLIPGDDIR